MIVHRSSFMQTPFSGVVFGACRDAAGARGGRSRCHRQNQKFVVNSLSSDSGGWAAAVVFLSEQHVFPGLSRGCNAGTSCESGSHCAGSSSRERSNIRVSNVFRFPCRIFFCGPISFSCVKSNLIGDVVGPTGISRSRAWWQRLRLSVFGQRLPLALFRRGSGADVLPRRSSSDVCRRNRPLESGI